MSGEVLLMPPKPAPTKTFIYGDDWTAYYLNDINTEYAMEFLRQMFAITSKVTDFSDGLPSEPSTMTGIWIQERNK